MVTPVPAQISNLPPRLRAARRRFHFRSRHSGASSTSRTPVRDLPTLRHFDTLSSPLCFHTLANPSSRNLFIFTSMQNPRGCTLPRSRRQTFRPSNPSTLLFASAWRLFVVSLHSFLHSFPLFSIVCSLFSENTRVGGTSTAYSRHSLTPSETEGSLATFNRPAHLTPAPRNFIFWLSTKRSVTNSIARRGMKLGFARRFVAGETLAEALAASRELCQQGRNVSLNHLGENVTTEAAAREVCASYIEMIEEMHAKNLSGNISIKLTQLGLDLSKDLCTTLAGSIARRARDLGRTIEMDMEGSAYTDATLDIFEAVQRESGNTGLAIQAYLHRTEKDLQRLAPLKPKIRLVKGAYREPKKLAVQGKPAVDANYKRLTTLLLEGAAQGIFLPAIASHDPFMVAHAQSEVSRLQLPKER